LIVVLLCVSVTTAAAGRIIVNRFKGPNAAKIERRVKAIAKLTTFSGDDIDVAGRVKATKKKRFVLVLVIKDRATGAELGTATLQLRKPKLDADAESAIASAFADAAAKPRDVAAGQPVTKPDTVAQQEPPKPAASEPAKPTTAPAATPPSSLLPPGPASESKPTARDPKELLPGAEVNADETPPPDPAPRVDKPATTPSPPEEPAARGRDPRKYIVEVALGAALVERTLQFQYDSAVTDRPVGYEGTLVAGGRASVEIYPFALGIAGEFERFTLRSQFPTGDAFDTTHMNWSAGLRLRWNLGSRPTLPTLTFGAGYGQRTFKLDTGGAAFDLPDVQYSYIDPSVRVKIPIGTPAFALRIEGRYLYLLGAGPLEEMQNYGGTKLTGWHGAAGLEVRLFKRLLIRATAEISRIEMTFDGTGAKTTMRDADPDQDVTSARDEYWGGHVMAGLVF
jgi:hypothetical protein